MYRAVVAMRSIFNIFKQLAPFMSQKVLKKAQDSTVMFYQTPLIIMQVKMLHRQLAWFVCSLMICQAVHLQQDAG